MLFPLGHENVTARRMPVVTIGLIAVNILVFLVTWGSIQRESTRLAEVRQHILLMAAMHPELRLSPAAQELTDGFRRDHPALWSRIANGQQHLADGWDARMRLTDDPAVLQAELDELCALYDQLQSSGILSQYAFIPAHPRTIAYLTSCFLHSGWLHIIFNMWFLWLTGFVLEDIWGRPLYLVFYLIAGAVAAQFFGWMDSTSTVPLVGASGAIAGLMGAFLVRFPKIKIEMGWLLLVPWFPFLRFFRFNLRAFFLLPLWVLLETFYGNMEGSSGGVAHWAHVGGFVFGAVGALLLRATGVEIAVTRRIDDEKAAETPLHIEEAMQLLAAGNHEEAETLLKQYLLTDPDSLPGLAMLRDIYERHQNVPQYLELSSRLCSAHLLAGFNQAAVKEYDEFLEAGGAGLPAESWLRLCRVLEERGEARRALTEYQGLAFAHDTELQSIMALLGAARVCLTQLNQPERALWFYHTAEVSRVPHLDNEVAIAHGIRAARDAIARAAPPPPAAAQEKSSKT